MPKENYIVAVDVGSSKISSIVASLEDSKISVIGTYSARSKGVKDGVINNIDEAVSAISETLSKTEMMSGHAISRVVVTVNGTNIESLNSHGVVAVSGANSEISAEDISRVNEAAQAISLPSSREIIHVIPREYIVDKQRGISDPVGMSGVRLEVEANIIHGGTTSLKNLSKCIQQVGVDIDQFVYTGLASAEAVLTDTEKELGTVLVDMGGETMSMVIYTAGKPIYSAVLPIGGQDITNDLAIGLRSLLEDAERIKLKLSEVTNLEEKEIYISKDGKEAQVPKGELYIGDLNIGLETVPRNMLNEIMFRRLEESFKFIQIYMKKNGFEGKLPAGVVLTGGVANTKGIEKIAQAVFNLPVRVGYPTGVTGLIDQIQGPAYASSIGVLKIIAENYKSSYRAKNKNNGNIKGIGDKVVNFVKSFLP
jgi:cell division protein FtsA